MPTQIDQKRTERIYYEDAYRSSFEATVLAIDGPRIELDATAFYPEGGGQPGDRGVIADVAVVDTQSTPDGRLVHVAAAGSKPSISVGDRVHCSIDWDFRFDYMQQHTGQHILSAVFLSLAGRNTVSVHQGEQYTTIEVDGGEISEDLVQRVEDRANEIICGDIAVRDFEVDESEVPALGLRRAPKVSGAIRIVEIDGIDKVACGGVHTARTAEVSLVRLLSTEKIRGNSRFAFAVGRRAHEHHRAEHRIVAALTDFLSVPADRVVSRVQDLDERTRAAERARDELRKELARQFAKELVSTSRAHATAEAGIGTGAAPESGAAPKENSGSENAPCVVSHDFGDEDPGFVRSVAECLTETGDALGVLLSRHADRSVWVVAHGGEISIDPQLLRGQAFPIIGAKGGGKPPLWQGAADRPEAFSEFVAAVVRSASKSGSG